MSRIETRSYQYTEGYADEMPGITHHSAERVVLIDDDGNEVIVMESKPHTGGYNEVQIGGDKSVRNPDMDERNNPLFIDDPDYDAKKLRRMARATKDIPLEKSERYVRRYMALSSMQEDVIARGSASGTQHPRGGDWGGINVLAKKKNMVGDFGLPDDVQDALMQASSSKEFAKIWVSKRNT